MDWGLLVGVLLYGLSMAAIGAVTVLLLRRETLVVLHRELDQAREAERVALDRLVGAWKDGATIPPRPSPPPPPVERLPTVLQDEIDQWSDAEHKAELEATMRLHLARGLSPAAILMQMDNDHPE